MIDTRTKRPTGDHGTANQAIEFALDHSDGDLGNMEAFLRGWREGDLDEWPDCPVPGCQSKICLALNSDKCFPHTPGNKHVKGWKIEARNPASDAQEKVRDGLRKMIALDEEDALYDTP